MKYLILLILLVSFKNTNAQISESDFVFLNRSDSIVRLKWCKSMDTLIIEDIQLLDSINTQIKLGKNYEKFIQNAILNYEYSFVMNIELAKIYLTNYTSPTSKQFIVDNLGLLNYNMQSTGMFDRFIYPIQKALDDLHLSSEFITLKNFKEIYFNYYPNKFCKIQFDHWTYDFISRNLNVEDLEVIQESKINIDDALLFLKSYDIFLYRLQLINKKK